MLEQGLFTLLTTDAGVSALIGARLYPVQGPPDNPTYPYITYQDVSAGSRYSVSSSSIDLIRRSSDSSRNTSEKAIAIPTSTPITTLVERLEPDGEVGGVASAITFAPPPQKERRAALGGLVSLGSMLALGGCTGLGATGARYDA